MKLHQLLLLSSLGGILAASADPAITKVTVTPPADGSGVVRVEYELSAPAVVTMDVTTNNGANAWVSIGGGNIWYFSAGSDVFRKVSGKDTYRIEWDAGKSWPGHSVGADGLRVELTAWPLGNTPDYLVADISFGAQPNTQRYYPSEEFLPGGLLDNPEYRQTKLVMKKVLAKDVLWTMGCHSETGGPQANETEHRVRLDHNYYLAVFPMTQIQSKEFYSACYYGVAEDVGMSTANRVCLRPEDRVCYNYLFTGSTSADVNYMWPSNPAPNSSLGKLRTRTGLDITLPSEAEWEFACRAGHGDGYWGDGSPITSTTNDPNFPGRFRYNYGLINNTGTPPQVAALSNATAVVGSYAPNSWGFYDMHGNVWEFCLDWSENYDTSRSPEEAGLPNIDPEHPLNAASGAAGVKRVIRGGTFYYTAKECRSAFRWEMSPSQVYYNVSTAANVLGYRVCCRAGLD